MSALRSFLFCISSISFPRRFLFSRLLYTIHKGIRVLPANADATIPFKTISNNNTPVVFHIRKTLPWEVVDGETLAHLLLL